MIRLTVLGSTRGTHLATLLDAIAQDKLRATIVGVMSNKADAYLLQRARDHQLPVQFIDPQGLTREEYDEKLSAALVSVQSDLIVLVGYMRILSAPFVAAWENKIINVHPSLLPAFAGLMDLTVHQAVLKAGEKETGCTVHFVTQEVDSGPAIVQKRCHVLASDTAESLKARVQALEGDALIEAIQIIEKRRMKRF